MYTDTLGKVTVGIGCLIDTPGAAWDTRNHGAPFVQKSDQSVLASENEVKGEWAVVKNDPTIKGHANLAKNVTSLQLTALGVQNLLSTRLSAFETELKNTAEFAALDTWPADAQLALASMAWAMGAGFGATFPNFRAACSAQDWSAAVQHCHMKNAWLQKRNAVNRGLFRNAAWAVDPAANPPNDPALLYLSIPGKRPELVLGDTDQTHAGQGFDSDDSVTVLQYFLGWLGFYQGPLNGIFDQDTDTAVRAFQTAEYGLTITGSGFPIDGEVGPLTWAALGYVVPRA